MVLIERLKEIDILLGSKSPRRKELLKSMDVDFTVEVRETDEYVDPTLSPHDAVRYIAETKLSAFAEESYWGNLVICADTVVVDGEGAVIGKPADAEEAIKVISGFMGKSHIVYTAVALAYQGRQISFVEGTQVWFTTLKPEEIAYYVEQYQPMDKAGSYGIQEWIGRVAIEKIEGSYENVIGLPTARLYSELKKLFVVGI